jgi:hypothetical protein
MKKRYKLAALGVEGGVIRAFVGVSKIAGEGQILGLGVAAMLAGDDVLDMKSAES